MNMKLLPLIIFSLFLIGCNGNDDEKGVFEGTWHDQESDVFIKVDGQGELLAFECANDNYELIENMSGSITGNEMTIIYDIHASQVLTYQIERIGNSMELTSAEFSFTVTNVDGIPLYCEKDWITITFASPEQVDVDTETTFIVNYDYRLASSEAVVEVGFTYNEEGAYVIVEENSDIISEIGLGSGSLMVNYTPTDFSADTPFSLHVNLSPTDQGNEYSPFASDSILITIIK